MSNQIIPEDASTGFIEQAFRAKHEWWRYLVGTIGAFLASQLGAVPLVVAVMLKIMMEDGAGSLSSLDEGTLMSTLDPNLTLFLMLLSFAIGLLALYLFIRYLHKQTFLEATTTRKKIDWGRVFFGFSLIAVFSIGTTVYEYYNNPEDYIVQFQLVPFLILAVVVVLMIPLQTSFEEYLFRGYLMQGIGVHAKNRWMPLLMTSVIFGGLHIANPEVSELGYIIMVYYIGTGLFLGIMTLMDEGMELALGFHAGNNMIAALLVTADWTVFQTNSILKDVSDPAVGFDIMVPVFVIYPLFLFLMSKRYKWTNWREKLFGEVKDPSAFEGDVHFDEIL